MGKGPDRAASWIYYTGVGGIILQNDDYEGPIAKIFVFPKFNRSNFWICWAQGIK